MKRLSDIPGIGEELELKYKTKGITIKNIKKHIDKLPIQSQMYLKYKPITKIPRSLIPKIVKSFANDKKNIIISGSYRREKLFCSDIDLLYIGKNKSMFKERKDWIIYSEGPTKLSGIYKYKSKSYKIDVWYANKTNLPFMLLYSTGSGMFNIIMRRKAKYKGYKLNQYGLWKNDKKIRISSEKGIFNKLNLPYYPPNQRNSNYKPKNLTKIYKKK